MTADKKRNIRNLGVGGAAILAVVGWALPKGADATIAAVDDRYVQRVTFTAFQQGLALKAQRDSLNGSAELREIRKMIAGLDSSDHCRRGFREFCR